MTRRRAERAFTLIEVMVALTLGSLLVLAVHRVFGASADLTRDLQARRTEHNRAMEARRTLTRMFAGLDLTSPSAIGFRGDASSIRFSSRVAGNGRASSLQISATESWLVLRREDGSTDRLIPAVRIAIDYLPAVGADTSWVRGWQSPVSAPVAVRLRLLTAEGGPIDTLLFTIGTRG